MQADLARLEKACCTPRRSPVLEVAPILMGVTRSERAVCSIQFRGSAFVVSQRIKKGIRLCV
jgi:hypothetical protein